MKSRDLWIEPWERKALQNGAASLAEARRHAALLDLERRIRAYAFLVRTRLIGSEWIPAQKRTEVEAISVTSSTIEHRLVALFWE